MDKYNFQKELERIWDGSVELYKSGKRDSSTYYDVNDLKCLSDNGITPQEIYDYVEDFCVSGEPDFATFILVSSVRRWYFIERMNSEVTGKTVNPSLYPAKNAEVDGIKWLPRIIEKARVKLRGELDSDTMYGCGGDRAFLRKYDIHLSEFLQKVADNFDDAATIINWVKNR